MLQRSGMILQQQPHYFGIRIDMYWMKPALNLPLTLQAVTYVPVCVVFVFVYTWTSVLFTVISYLMDYTY